MVDDGDRRGGRAVGADGGHREDDLVELDRRGLDGIDGLAAAAGDQDIRLLAFGHLHDRGDVGARAIGAVDVLDENLHPGAFERGFDSRRRGRKGALAADQGNLFGAELRERSGQLVEAVLADRIIAHSNGAHTEPSFMW